MAAKSLNCLIYMFGSFFFLSALAARIRVNGIKSGRFSYQPKIKIKNMSRIYYHGVYVCVGGEVQCAVLEFKFNFLQGIIYNGQEERTAIQRKHT